MKNLLKHLSIVVLLLFVIGKLHAQNKAIESKNLLWPHYFLTFKCSEKITTRFDASGRWLDNVSTFATFHARAGLFYKLNESLNAGGGYAYFLQYPLNAGEKVIKPEHRLFQQITSASNIKRVSIQHRYMLEERFLRKADNTQLLDGYRFNYRFRYMLSLSIPFKGDKVAPKIPYLILSDELFVNFGKQIVYNYFDQNRVFVGLGYQFSKSLTATTGYQHTFQQRSSGNRFEEIHTWRITIFQNISLIKKALNE